MVSINAKLVLILSLILLNMKECHCTHISKGHNHGLTRTRISSSTFEKEMYDCVPSAAEIGRPSPLGRKVPLRASLENKIGRKGSLNNGEGSRALGGAHFVRKLNNKWKRKLNVEHNLLKRHRHHHGKHDSESFMAFTADYRVPSHHPPRHN